MSRDSDGALAPRQDIPQGQAANSVSLQAPTRLEDKRSRTNRDRFDRLQAEIRALDAQKSEVLIALAVKYGNKAYASKTELKRLDAFDPKIRTRADKIFALLAVVSPRNWHEGVPWHWIITELTYDDAITSGALSAVPPPAYGRTPQDSARFSAALSQE